MSRLYTPQLLALAAELSNYPLGSEWPFHSQVRSPICGSTMALGIALDRQGRIERMGMQVTACAIGQSSAAILAGGAKGRDPGELARVRGDLESWLDGEGALPEWPRLELLEPAREHAGRRGALMLPWNAALEALPTNGTSR